MEVAIELETAIERALEEHFEAKVAANEFIDRAEFLRRIQARQFQVEASCYDQIEGHERKTFDHWLGNVSQWVVQPRKKVGVVVTLGRVPSSGSLIPENTYDYAYLLMRPDLHSPPNQVYSIENRNARGNWTNSKKKLLVNPQELKNILEVIYSTEDIRNNNFFKITNLSAQQVQDLENIHPLQQSAESLENSTLLTSWDKTEPTVLAHLHKHYFPHCFNFRHVVDNKAYTEAVNILNDLSPHERAFWNALFEQHCAAVGYDDLAARVKAFQAFVEKMKEKDLIFYTPCHFKDVKSLPVALSRMLTILNNTPQADLKLVWEQITKLDLQSNAAVRLINDVQKKPGSGHLVVLEIKIA